jgi:branched-chain amino acid transport system permease protein
LSAQTVVVVVAAAALLVALWLFFGRTLYGRPLRAPRRSIAWAHG